MCPGWPAARCIPGVQRSVAAARLDQQRGRHKVGHVLGGQDALGDLGLPPTLHGACRAAHEREPDRGHDDVHLQRTQHGMSCAAGCCWLLLAALGHAGRVSPVTCRPWCPLGP